MMLKIVIAATLMAASAHPPCENLDKCDFPLSMPTIKRLADPKHTSKWGVKGHFNNPAMMVKVCKAGVKALEELKPDHEMNTIEFVAKFKFLFFSKLVSSLHESRSSLLNYNSGMLQSLWSNNMRSNALFAEFVIFFEDFLDRLLKEVETSLKVMLQVATPRINLTEVATVTHTMLAEILEDTMNSNQKQIIKDMATFL